MSTAMIMLVICGMVGVAFAVGWFVPDGLRSSRRQVEAPVEPTLELSPLYGLSEVARQLVKEYDELPEESRPFPDIIPMVRGLDAKIAVDSVRRARHFDERWLPYTKVQQSGDYQFSWNARGAANCQHRQHCPFHEYVELHRAIMLVKKALDRKERAILASTYASDTDMIGELMTRLRDEAQLQDDFVRDFKRLD